MAKRRHNQNTKRESDKERKAREKQQERSRKSRRQVLYVIVSLAVIISVVVAFSLNVQPVYVQCFNNGTELKEDYAVWMIIENGSSNNSFFRIPVPLGWQGQNIFKMGVYADCKYPINVQGESDYGPEFVKLHIQSPYIHDYTLGDFFSVWDHEMHGAPYYLGSDGIQPPGYTYVSGPVVVSFSFGGPTQPANPGLPMHSGDKITIRVNP